MPTRILFSVFGSAGDLFPLLPVIKHLTNTGCEVRVATSRAAGLYTRVAGIDTIALGDGTDTRLLRDPVMSSDRFDGWTSWRHAVLSYVLPTLADDVLRIETIATAWMPDLVVAGSFATAARIAAYNLGLPVLDVSVYPQHDVLGRSSHIRAFAAPFRESALRLLHPGVANRIPTAKWLWGSPADVLVHDRSLLGASSPELDPVGFPAWNGVPTKPDEAAAATEFLAEPGRSVIATLGSFRGQHATATWLAIAEAAMALRARLLMVGAPTRWATEEFANEPDILAVGFLDLSAAFPSGEVIIHHGGIGTTMAALRAGRPSVVLPHAFDNMFNGRLLHAAGAGACSVPTALTADLESTLASSPLRDGAARIAGRLVSSADAASTIAGRCVDALESRGRS